MTESEMPHTDSPEADDLSALHPAGPASEPAKPRKRVAVMQPYFFPYAGYFRLFSQVDEFVIFDCVQFPRRGRVHRTEVPGPGGGPEWLTLPIARQPRSTPICDLMFAPEARAQFDQRLARLPWVNAAAGPAANRLRDFLHAPLTSVIDYLETGLRLVNDLLGITTVITRSSALRLPASLRGQDRILTAAQAVAATGYLNAPGGRDLYNAAAFDRVGIKLDFLPSYKGQFFQLLPSLMSMDPQCIRNDIEPGQRDS